MFENVFHVFETQKLSKTLKHLLSSTLDNDYLQTRFQKSWDTVQIVNKNRMQWCGSFKFQYFIQNTT